MRSAARRASSTSGRGRTRRGTRRTRADAFARARDVRFAGDDRAVFEFGFEGDVLRGGWENAAADRQHLRRDAHGLGKVAGDVGERGEKKIAETVAGKPAPGGKAILKKFAEQVFVLRKRDHAIADIAGRENAVFAAQAAGTAAVVGDGDDGGEIGDGMARRVALLAVRRRIP